MNFKIKPKDVQDFFKILGYDWNGMIIDGPDERLMTEKDLESYDTVYIIWNPRFDNSKILGFNVNFEIFQFMTSDLDYDSRISYYPGKDFSIQWIKFLIRRYKEKYAYFMKEKINKKKDIIYKNYEIEKKKIENMLSNLNKKTLKELNKCKPVEDLISKNIHNNDITM